MSRGHVPYRVWLVQQGVWDMALESMPLAIGYLKASVLGDEHLAAEVDVELFNFKGGATTTEIATRLFGGPPPDVLAFSVLGWNYRTFGEISITYKQLKPDGVVVFGGNHVANQAERVFRMFPTVDVVVNGEGEVTFPAILRALLADRSRDGSALVGIPGISTVVDGGVVTTEKQERIADLDSIPSPFLSGAIPMLDHDGKFRYDVALMETNRGCPYACSFCYWGGAVGQRVRTFSRERLRAELEMFAGLEVATIITCDANFGLLPRDEEFVEDFIHLRERYGFPLTLESSWAKNKSNRFRRIVSTMKEAGVRTSFTLALQTLDEAVLEGMRRNNMRINQWHELVDWLDDQDMTCLAELIWGAPGDTYDSFLDGYDRLAQRVPRIATYPLLILPNTAYDETRAEHGFVTVRGDRDDFEYILAHKTVSLEENLEMQRFLYWARILAENSILRLVWRPLREVLGLSQSQALLRLDRYVANCERPEAEEIVEEVGRVLDATMVSDGIRRFYGDPTVMALLEMWWRHDVVPTVPAEWKGFFESLIDYETLMRPKTRSDVDDGVGTRTVGGQQYYVRQAEFPYDMPAALAGMEQGHLSPPAPRRWSTAVFHPVGFEEHLDSAEVAYHFRGHTEAELEASEDLQVEGALVTVNTSGVSGRLS
jgi:radical SAM C-methyltransferase